MMYHPPDVDELENSLEILFSKNFEKIRKKKNVKLAEHTTKYDKPKIEP